MGLFFENPNIRCPENPKQFLFFKWFGYHDFEITSIKPWGDSSWKNWEISVICKVCGARDRTFGVTDTQLLRVGVDLKAMQEHGSYQSWRNDDTGTFPLKGEKE